jgi:hypothetical protein
MYQKNAFTPKLRLLSYVQVFWTITSWQCVTSYRRFGGVRSQLEPRDLKIRQHRREDLQF